VKGAARGYALLVGLAGLAVLAGCARHVVLDPSDVDQLNDRAWTVTAQPGDPDAAAPATPAGATPASPPEAAPAPAPAP
jgi:hypothetical protein